MSPQLQHAIRLLQLSSQDLIAEINSIVETNPLLELIDYPRSHTATRDLEATSSSEASLKDYLCWQLQHSHIAETEYPIALALIEGIDDAGYLTIELADVDPDLAKVQKVLHTIQQFDPVGVGARNLRECLLLQLNSLNLAAKVKNICSNLIENHFDLLRSKNYAALRKHLTLETTQEKTILAIIQNLNPHPGASFNTKKIEYITPDVIIEQGYDKLQIKLNTNLLPQLELNNKYISLMQRATNLKDRNYFREKLTEAKWLLHSLEVRNKNVLLVAEYLINYQQDFLLNGDSKMRPLTMQQMAIYLNLSESTISRIVNSKYVQTPRGTYCFKHLINGKATSVKAVLQQILQSEHKDKPLSDQQLMQLLAAQGIQIARRTVNKYRTALGILSSNQRGI